MDKRKRFVLAGVILAVLAAVGTGVGVAAGGDDDRSLAGDAYDRATEAALAHVGGGSVLETESGDDGAAYEVEIRKDDGTVVEVGLDSRFEVIDTATDDDDAEGRDDDNDGD